MRSSVDNAIYYECTECGALLTYGETQVHEFWHSAPNTKDQEE